MSYWLARDPYEFVTEAYMLLDMKNHWTSYYKRLQRGRWSWLLQLLALEKGEDCQALCNQTPWRKAKKVNFS